MRKRLFRKGVDESSRKKGMTKKENKTTMTRIKEMTANASHYVCVIE